MAQFDGSSDRLIVVLDICSIHHVTEAVDKFRKAGIMALFLPPNNPANFSYIKPYLKSHDKVLQAVSDLKTVIKMRPMD